MTKRNQLLSLALISVTFLVLCCPTNGSQGEALQEEEKDMPTWGFVVLIVGTLFATQIIGNYYERHFYPGQSAKIPKYISE